MGFFSGAVAASAVALVTASMAQAHGLELDLPQRYDILQDIRLPPLPDLGGLSKLGKPKGPVVVYLDRDGGRIEAGRDDGELRRSGVVQRSGFSHVDIAAYQGSDAGWNWLVGCVEKHYVDFDVQIVDERPQGDDYITVMVGGDPDTFGFAPTVGGIAPYDGSVLRDAVVFVFETPHRDTTALCETTAHEIGHALGLDHTRDCNDLMSYERCGNKAFQYDAMRCGEWEDRTCSDGAEFQSSWGQLAEKVGVVHGHDDDHGHGHHRH